MGAWGEREKRALGLYQLQVEEQNKGVKNRIFCIFYVLYKCEQGELGTCKEAKS